jgi:catechol 2,3-dioxygenase-like lactoylglutathione lyase family enzyme
MTIQRMDHVGIVVDDLAGATAFFVELGLELQGEGSVEGGWVDRVVGLEDIRAQIAMLETPDGHGRLELTEFHAPPGPVGDQHAPPNTPGLRHLTFAVDDIDAVLARLRAPSSSARWSATATAIGSATSAARRASSSSWRNRSAEGSDQPPNLLPGVSGRLEAGSRYETKGARTCS